MTFLLLLFLPILPLFPTIASQLISPTASILSLALVWALSSADIQNKVTAGGINLPSRVGAEYIQAFLDSIPPQTTPPFSLVSKTPSLKPPLWNANFATIDGVSQKYIDQYLRGEISEQEFAEGVCYAVNANLP